MTISINKLINIIIFIYVFSAVLMERTILGNISLVLVFALALTLIVSRKKVEFNLYFALEILFLLFCIGENIFEIPVYKDIAKSRINTLFLCFIFEIFVYNCILYKNNLLSIVNKSIVPAIFWSLLILICINFSSLMYQASREETAGINIGGIMIGQTNSVAIGWMAGTGLILDAVFVKEEKKIYRIIKFVFFSIAIVLSGTRKALVFILIAILIGKILKENNKNVIFKSIKNIIFVLLVAVLIIYLSLKIPMLYNLFGNRIESMLNHFLSGTKADTSIITRLKLREIGWNAFKQKPIWGWGLDNFKYVFYEGKFYTHNNFLEIAVSTGSIGFIIFYSKYFYLLKGFCKIIKHGDKTDFKITLSLLISYLTFIFLEFWQVTYFTRKTLLTYLLFLIYVQIKLRKIRGGKK